MNLLVFLLHGCRQEAAWPMLQPEVFHPVRIFLPVHQLGGSFSLDKQIT